MGEEVRRSDFASGQADVRALLHDEVLARATVPSAVARFLQPRRCARDYMRQNPGFGVFDLLALAVCKYLPARVSWIVLGVAASIALTLTPLHLQLLREHLEGADAL